MGTFDRFKRIFSRKRESVMVDSESYQGVERRAEPRAPSSAELKILVVDDSKTIVTVLRKMLSQNGYTVFTAVDGKEAIELATQHRPDVIFLDIVMPGMNGFAALRGLRRGQETRSIPVIMMSGNEQATEEFYVQRIGADDFMKKPFSRAEVFARIERLLANRNTAAQAQG